MSVSRDIWERGSYKNLFLNISIGIHDRLSLKVGVVVHYILKSAELVKEYRNVGINCHTSMTSKKKI